MHRRKKVVRFPRLNEVIGWLFYHLGVTPSHSWGIHDGPTAGYGHLDHNGYFHFPIRPPED